MTRKVANEPTEEKKYTTNTTTLGQCLYIYVHKCEKSVDGRMELEWQLRTFQCHHVCIRHTTIYIYIYLFNIIVISNDILSLSSQCLQPRE